MNAISWAEEQQRNPESQTCPSGVETYYWKYNKILGVLFRELVVGCLLKRLLFETPSSAQSINQTAANCSQGSGLRFEGQKSQQLQKNGFSSSKYEINIWEKKNKHKITGQIVGSIQYHVLNLQVKDASTRSLGSEKLQKFSSVH